MAGEDVRRAPLDISGEEFRRLGHLVVDRIATHFDQLRDSRVGPNEPVTVVRDLLGTAPLPEGPTANDAALEEAMSLLFDHAVYTAHPRFWAYITGSAAPIGALGDLIAAALNSNVASWNTAGAASAFEAQAVTWMGQLLGLDPSYSGLLVSGGSAANLVSFIVARRAKAGWNVRAEGTHNADRGLLRVYASREAHPWLGRAVDVTGLGAHSVHWIDIDDRGRMAPDALRAAIKEDREAGQLPFLVIGSAGTVGLGTVDRLFELADISAAEDLWFHVDAAYGGFAVCSSEAPEDLQAMRRADSVAIDPHKWLYVPLEAGCVLLKQPSLLAETFTYDSSFFTYTSAQAHSVLPAPYREQGLQNSRAFRALKLWLCLKTAGRTGYEQMISEDIKLSKRLFQAADARPELEAMSNSLSTTVFRYVPHNLASTAAVGAYLDTLNTELLRLLQLEGYAYPSLTKVRGATGLRVCIVNFRTQWSDLSGLLDWCVRRGAVLDASMRPDALR